MRASVWSNSEPTVSAELHPKPLLLVGRSGFIPSCNILALVHQFPDLAIWHATTLAAPFSDTVSPAVMLVDQAYLSTLTAAEEALVEAAGDRIVAVVDEAVPTQSATVHRLLSQNLIRGVLPMNLRLEVWLLAVNLFVMGGEFVPASLLRTHLRAAKKKEPPQRNTLSSVKADIDSLTERELQVLEMVSAGSSNRTIARRFSLSEHTIKVHVHNIIRKLNASNRTAAAATYLEAMRAAADAAKLSGKAAYSVPA